MQEYLEIYLRCVIWAAVAACFLITIYNNRASFAEEPLFASLWVGFEGTMYSLLACSVIALVPLPIMWIVPLGIVYSAYKKPQ